MMSMILVFVTLIFFADLIARNLSAVSEHDISLSVRGRFEKNYASYLLTLSRIMFLNSVNVLLNRSVSITMIFSNSKSVPVARSFCGSACVSCTAGCIVVWNSYVCVLVELCWLFLFDCGPSLRIFPSCRSLKIWCIQEKVCSRLFGCKRYLCLA